MFSLSDIYSVGLKAKLTSGTADGPLPLLFSVAPYPRNDRNPLPLLMLVVVVFCGRDITQTAGLMRLERKIELQMGT